SGNATLVLATFGMNSDFAATAAPGWEAKYAATLAMSSALSCVATAVMVATVLAGPPRREPSLNAFSWFSMEAARCAARLGIASLTLTPFAPWHAAHTSAAFALPASTFGAACTAGTPRTTAASAASLFTEASGERRMGQPY